MPSKEVARVEVQRVTPERLVLGDAQLKHCDLVRHCGESCIAALLQPGRARRFPTNSTVYALGDAAGSLYFVLKGEARLLGRDAGAEVAFVRRGDVFGEGGERITHAVADGELDVIEVSLATVTQVSRAHRALHEFLSELAKKRQADAAELEDFLKRW